MLLQKSSGQNKGLKLLYALVAIGATGIRYAFKLYILKSCQPREDAQLQRGQRQSHNAIKDPQWYIVQVSDTTMMPMAASLPEQ